MRERLLLLWLLAILLGCSSQIVVPPPVVLATGQTDASHLCSDGTHLYWTTRTPGARDDQRTVAILRMPKAGGAVTKLLEIKGQNILRLVAAETGVYYVRAEYGHAVAAVEWLPKGATAPVELGSMQQEYGLAIDATSVYWSDGTAVYAAPKSGGPTRTVVRTSLYDFSIDKASVYMSSHVNIGTSVPILMVAPKTGGAPRVLPRIGPNPFYQNLVISGDLAFGGTDLQNIVVHDLRTGAYHPLCHDHCVAPYAVSGDRVYFKFETNTIGFLPLREVAADEAGSFARFQLRDIYPSSLVIDGHTAYMASQMKGIVVRQSLPR